MNQTFETVELQLPPEGFVLHTRRSPLTVPWEPIYERALPDRLLEGLCPCAAHTNTRSRAHGGLIAALGDKAIRLSCVIARGMSQKGVVPASFVTVSLSVDYLDAARVGQ